jgi:hypothetical protein
MKNIIFIPAYNGFDKEYSECIESWKYYAKKWDIQLIIANEERQYEFEVWGNGVF